MERLKKVQIVVVVVSLVLTICFPPVIITVQAAPSLENSVYYVEAEELRGTSSFFDLISSAIGGAVEIETDATFYNSRLKNMTLRKLIQTDRGPMLITMRSTRQNEYIDTGTLYIRMKGLTFDFWASFATLFTAIKDVKVNILELESSRLQINDLSLEISFDPNEINQFRQMQRSLQQVDPKENLEEALLLLDEMEGGKLSKQKEAFETMIEDLPNQEEKANQIGQMLDDAEQQSSDIHNNIKELDDVLSEKQEENKSDEQLENVTQQFKNYTNLLEQIGVSIDEIEQTLTNYVEMVNLRAQYLQELGLIDWSESYNEFIKVKDLLHNLVSNVETHVERYNKLNEQKNGYEEKLSQLKEQIAAIGANALKEVEEPQKDVQKQTNKQLNGQLEEFQEEETSLLESIIEENEIPEDVDIEQLKVEIDAFLTEKAEEIEKLTDEKEQQKAVVKVLKETLSQYSTLLIAYYEKLNAQKQELEKNSDADTEQLADLEVKIKVIENIIARIEEFDEELSLLIE